MKLQIDIGCHAGYIGRRFQSPENKMATTLFELFITFLASLGQMVAVSMLLQNWMSLFKRVIVSFLVVTGYLYVWVERVGKNDDVFRYRWVPCLVFSLIVGLVIAFKDKSNLRKMARENAELEKEAMEKEALEKTVIKKKKRKSKSKAANKTTRR